MNSEEQTLIDGLFTKLKSAETASSPRDNEAEARIKEHLTGQPAAPYYMAQAILVQEAAVNQLGQQLKERDEQIQKLQAELQQAKTQPSSAPAQGGGGFLSSIFGGGGSREPQAQRPASPPSGGGWRDSGPSSPPPYNAAPNNAAPYNAPPGANYAAPQQQAPRGGGFMSGALQTAAGVAGGVMLAQGLSSMFGNHSQPQEVVEVIKEEPAQVADSGNNDSGGGWGDDQQRVTSNDSYDNDQGGGWDDGGGFDGGDDDSFV